MLKIIFVYNFDIFLLSTLNNDFDYQDDYFSHCNVIEFTIITISKFCFTS
jgi:hypothetical protein